MTLRSRLWLSGALLPVVVLALALLVADRLFHLALERSLDQALLAQAAVESVSLFDGPEEHPHLHMATSPLVESVRPFAPQGTLFGPDGRALMRYPPALSPDEGDVLRADALPATPVLSTVLRPGGAVRQLVVAVPSPRSGKLYALRLTASLAQLEASAFTLHWIAVATVLAAAAVLVLVQLLQARSLMGRLAQLGQHLHAVQAGDLEHPLPPDSSRDELSALRDVLAAATAALQRARAAQERLLADAAHELRTPLTLMRTHLDLALRKDRPVEALKGTLAEVRDEVDRLTALSGKLLDVAALKGSAAGKAPADLVAIFTRAVDAARPEAEARGVRLEVSFPQAAPAVVDAEALRQAADNLLSNALKFAPAGSAVRVALAAASPGWRLVVEDEGPGVAPAEREAVFEPFHRSPGAPAGTGLGLTIVREVARRHDGTSKVEDSPRGARLVLELR